MKNRRSEELCREFRREMTPTEAQLWEVLRDRRLVGAKFRRQHPFGGIIADFYCPERALVVEVDGGVHNLPEQREKDLLRDAELAGRGLTVLHFTNTQIEEQLQEVIAAIRSIKPVEKQPGSAAAPSPSQMERGAEGGVRPTPSAAVSL